MTIKRRIERLESTTTGNETGVRLHFVNDWEPDPAPPPVSGNERLITVRFCRPAKDRNTYQAA
ncbi:hypothetical protein [Sphingomonas yabuuchiae]|uniref:hypothetical protein n=1 Tax=Sphingomonas yabuuchiae TaxID=172044 RepID=UPI000A9BCCAD|nr:hypothetical protein [Sphingomonas yabuuchiae]